MGYTVLSVPSTATCEGSATCQADRGETLRLLNRPPTSKSSAQWQACKSSKLCFVLPSLSSPNELKTQHETQTFNLHLRVEITLATSSGFKICWNLSSKSHSATQGFENLFKFFTSLGEWVLHKKKKIKKIEDFKYIIFILFSFPDWALCGTTDARHRNKALMKFPLERDGGRWKSQIELDDFEFREAKVKETQQGSVEF